MQEKIYFISITTENSLRVLQRVSSILSRYRINIEQLNVFETAKKGVSHFSLVINSNEDKVNTIIKKLDNVIEIIDIGIVNSIDKD